MEHAWNHILSPPNPPCGLISLFRPVWLQSDPIPWKQTCGLDPRWILFFLYGLQPSTEGGSVWKRGKDPPAFWHVFSSPTFLQGWQAYCTLPLCRGNFALLEESGKLEKENWDRNRKYDRGKGAAERQRTLEINIKCGSLLLQKLSCKIKNIDSPESTVSSKRQI